MVTGVQEREFLLHHPELLQKNKRTRSTSQPQIRNENTPAIIEADQTLLALQQ